MINRIQIHFFYRISCVLIALSLTIAVLPQAKAQLLDNSTYAVAIASSERLLDAMDEYGIGSEEYRQVQEEESCDSPFYRILARNIPAILIQNISNTEADFLTSFTIAINVDDNFFGENGDKPNSNFADYIKRSVYTSPGVEITDSYVDIASQELTLEFNGFSPDESVIFRVDLDTDDPEAFEFPDFRSVLFEADEQGNPTDNTGETWATFSKSSDTIPTPLIHNPNFNMEWEEGNTRPYHAIDPVVPGIGHGGVPEPTSLLLMLIGLAGTTMRRRR